MDIHKELAFQDFDSGIQSQLVAVVSFDREAYRTPPAVYVRPHFLCI